MSGQNMDYSDVRIHALESELARVKAELEKHGVCKLIEQERDNLKETLKKMKLAEKTIDFLQDNDGPYIEELQKDRDAWKQKAERYEAALKKIVEYGRPLEAPRASYVVCEINDIAKEALKGC